MPDDETPSQWYRREAAEMRAAVAGITDCDVREILLRNARRLEDTADRLDRNRWLGPPDRKNLWVLLFAASALALCGFACLGRCL